MITEDYVSQQTARLLKEKGFDEECNMAYFNETLVDYTMFGFCLGGDLIYCPTQQMAMKWLREIHHCVICITPLTFYCGEIVSAWGCNIWADDNLEVDDESTPKFITYEEACEYSIQYCLENLI